MDDKLEKFILANRQAFDEEEPSRELWEQIRKKGGGKKSTKTVYWKVAAVFLLISTIFLIIEKKISNDTASVMTAWEQAEAGEFGEAEAYYTQLIDQKKAEVAQFDDSELKRSFFSEIDRLDALYNELKETYQNQNSTDLLTDAMISNLRLRIDILDQQLKILTKLKNERDDSESIIES